MHKREKDPVGSRQSNWILSSVERRRDPVGEEEGELGHALCSSAHNRGCALRDDLYPRNTQHFAETISCQT